MPHEHLKTCEHTVKYCAVCDVAYCETCNKEWTSRTNKYPPHDLQQYWREYMNPQTPQPKVIYTGATQLEGHARLRCGG
mgnify:CR=1 FL=1